MESTSDSPKKVSEATLKAEKALKTLMYQRLGVAALSAALLATAPSVAKNISQNIASATTSKESQADNKLPATNINPKGLPTAGAETILASSPNISEASYGDLEFADLEFAEDANEEEAEPWDGPVLNSYDGRIDGPSGQETYYNLNMKQVVKNMHDMGFEGGYWVRDDGVKMFGDYVMVAADLEVHPRGSLVKTSLGTGIVCDTGDFIKDDPTQLDIATSW